MEEETKHRRGDLGAGQDQDAIARVRKKRKRCLSISDSSEEISMQKMQ